MSRKHTATGGLRAVAVVLACLAALMAVTPSASAESRAGDTQRLYLVTLEGPGAAGYHGALPPGTRRLVMRIEQDRVLARVDAPEPVYRWLSALNGFAVRLTEVQADSIRTDRRVRLVEADAVRRLAGHAAAPAHSAATTPAGHGGKGQVVGVVDSGIWRQSPLFSPVAQVRGRAAGFRGSCDGGEDWSAHDCNAKLVGARYFVRGFGADRLRTGTPLSATDDSGHGTAVASIAVGNAGVSASLPGQRLGSFSGAAPQARLAVYKACWTAPDPDDDGCSTADLVTAVDRATSDGVDVLNLAVTGPPSVDTVELALLGAAEADVAVVAAAGNDGDDAYAAHPVPWVTSVGASAEGVRRGVARTGSGASWTGTMTARRGVGPARVVLSRDVPAATASPADAAACLPGSLDVSRTEGAVVVCERGRIGRIEKSAAVRSADGVGMVLVNTTRGPVPADLHAVPTVHLDRADGAALVRWVERHPHGRLALRPDGHSGRPHPVAWSSAGDASGGVLKPDLLAPGVGVLAASPPTTPGGRWTMVSGTSAATAAVAGLAASLRSQHPAWSATRVRSVLTTTAAPLPGAALRQGAGLVQPGRRPGLVLDTPARAYRSWLEDPGHDLNTASLLVRGGSSSTRTLTNVTGRAGYWSSHVHGFASHHVSVTPAAVRLRPGRHARFTVRVTGSSLAVDGGWVVWRGADGTEVRIPVVVSR